MSEQNEIPFLATHVDSLEAVPEALMQMSLNIKSDALSDLADRWAEVVKWPGLPPWSSEQEIPGILEWGRRPSEEVKTILYVIWRNPWMVVSQDTFIGSVLEKCGLKPYIRTFSTKYPEVDFGSFDPKETLLLFSSEPYPFLKKREELFSLSNPYAFVDGESFSWFGVRALDFLQRMRTRRV